MKHFKGFVVFLVFILGLCSPAKAQFEGAVWDTLTADTLEDKLTSQAIAVNGYEEFHLASAKHRPGGGWNIYYRFFDIFNGIYPESVVVDDMPCFGPVIASRFSDNDYDIVILYASGDEIYSCVSHSRYGPWERTNVTNSLDPETRPSVAYGSQYYHGAWISNANLEFKIAYMKAGNSEPTAVETIEESELGEFGLGANPFIATRGDTPHIFYRGVNGNSFHIHHAWRDHPDSAWNIEFLSTPNADDYTVSGDINGVGDISLAVSGNGGFGFPGRIYYLEWDHNGGEWANPRLVTGQYSATNASLTLGYDGVIIASCGVSGNIYEGNVYLSNDSSGTFQTVHLGNFQSVTQPVIANVIYEYGAVIFDAPVGQDLGRNIELIYYGFSFPSSIDELVIPHNKDLSSCYPNPFNSQTIINFVSENQSHVTIDIFDILGKRIDVLLNEVRPAGEHKIIWNGNGISSGVYFYRIRIDNHTETKKMVLLK